MRLVLAACCVALAAGKTVHRKENRRPHAATTPHDKQHTKHNHRDATRQHAPKRPTPLPPLAWQMRPLRYELEAQEEEMRMPKAFRRRF